MENGGAALVVAHPGHEARLHGWMEREKPSVFILTDGGGRLDRPRMMGARNYLASLEVPEGRIFGRFPEREVYRMLLERDIGPLVALARELANAFVESGIRVVAADASEGCNSTHDAGSMLCSTAVAMAEKLAGAKIETYDFPLMNRPDHCASALRERAIWLRLDDQAFARKITAAFRYYPELAAEIQEALRSGRHPELGEHFPDERDAATDLKGLDVFRIECLRPLPQGAPAFETERPYYEIHGERQVAAGHYRHVIRYREHLLPLADALRAAVERLH